MICQHCNGARGHWQKLWHDQALATGSDFAWVRCVRCAGTGLSEEIGGSG